MRSVAFRNAAIFDGRELLSANTVLVEKGNITQVGQDLLCPRDSTSIDCSGCTLLPGLIDAHVHLQHEGNLRQALVFGVTTQLDMFMDPRDTNYLKSLSKRNSQSFSDLFSSGYTSTCEGGHCTQFSLKVPTINNPSEADSFVEQRIAEGSDYIKLIYDDGTTYGDKMPTISKEILEAVIKAAKKRKILTVVHIGSYQEAFEAIDAGCDGLAHLFSNQAAGEVFFALVKKRGSFITPTLTVIQNCRYGAGRGKSLVRDANLAPYLTLKNIEQLNWPVDALPGDDFSIPTLPLLKKWGITILAGSDAPNPGTDFGATLHGELELLVEAGLTASEALTAATAAPASCFNLPDRGRISPGMAADLLLVNGKPTENILDTRRIAGVWRQGHPVDRDGYKDVVAEQQAAVSGSTVDLV